MLSVYVVIVALMWCNGGTTKSSIVHLDVAIIALFCFSHVWNQEAKERGDTVEGLNDFSLRTRTRRTVGTYQRV